VPVAASVSAPALSLVKTFFSCAENVSLLSRRACSSTAARSSPVAARERMASTASLKLSVVKPASASS
jgi:hypothetical protein